MRFSRSESVRKRRKDKKLGSSSKSRKKHKRLDAICEDTYTRNHSGVQKVELVEANVESNEGDLRRSNRVRKAPVVLDASPAPPKKRQKIDKKSGVSSLDRGKRVVEVKSETQLSNSRSLEEGSSGWRSRLRNRGKSVSFKGRKKGGSTSKGRRKLFQDLDGDKEELELGIEETDDKEEVLVDGDSDADHLEEANMLSVPENEHEDNDLGGDMGVDKQLNEETLLGFGNEETDLLPRSENECVNGDGLEEALGPQKLVAEDDLKFQTSPNLKVNHSPDGAGALEHDVEPGKTASVSGDDQINTAEVCTVMPNVDHTKDGEHHDKPLEGGISKKLNENKKNHALDCKLRPVRIKVGRHCGLCGGGTDGKPPQRLAQDGTVSDIEAYSGGSASEEPNYDILDGFGDEPGWLGRLLGPINDRFGIAGIWVHQQCAVWSPEVYFAGLGCLKNVRAALCRGRALKCSRCGRPGATIGCRVDRCPKTYHLPCARDCGSIFDHRKFLIACSDHRHLFQPQGNQFVHRLKKLKVKKMKLDLRKVSNEALRKDREAEEKWLENCGEDEEFLKRESKRLHRDLLRIAPVYIGGGNCDSGMQFQGWESVAGLQDVIQCMKEVVILPLLYPDFFGNIGLTPPRGVLLHGHPGTGKTLVVRALIGSCSRGDKKIAYFARKGADCLGKYVGDAERQLRLLFQVAERSQPSIIFFDEIDGLAPCRSGQQDQTHSSVVSTLLALMDGLKSRGSVVVIGATNRPDSIDPALRRPGRFDREIYFPLPSMKDREAILTLHTQKWPKPISGSLLTWVASRTVGFAGADLQALCTQAVIVALRRSVPLQEILSSSGQKASLSKRPPLPSFNVEERDWLDAISAAPPPCSRREAGIAANDMVSSPLVSHLIPCLLQPLTKLLVSLYLDDHVWLPPPLFKAATLIKTVLTSSLDKKKVQCDNWWSNVDDLLQETDILVEIEDNLSCATVLIEDASGHLKTLEDLANDVCQKFKPPGIQRIGARPGLLRTFVDESGKRPGFRILISGKPRSGQRHIASCLLHCFVGNIENRKLDLATMFQEGHGDVVQGLTQILMRCANAHPSMIFLPRIDLWAMETEYQSCEEQSDSPSSRCIEAGDCAETSETKDAVKTASYLWNMFIEQVESISVCTSLMILATSEVPFVDLPCRIGQFFGSEMLNNSLSRHLKDAVPRFVVQVDGNLNHNRVFENSAAKLSKDLVQYFIHLVHLRNHKQSNSLGEKKSFESVEGNIDTSHQNMHPGSAASGANKYPTAPVTSVALRNPVKGKPNSVIAISTFGYQILQYPHFAELCWFTSKLKEGPCTHINGPWKGWPFNSCIVRPANTPERATVTSSSSVPRNKEKPCLVRGLAAIGLSAYRSEYMSIREVSLEVRKVLELLVGLVNDKIQAGKDKYKFFRLLSQVAYFEDMVSSWAYTLRSFDVDAQVLEGSSKQIGVESLKHSTISLDSLPEGDDCKRNIPNDTLHEANMLQQDSRETDAKIIEIPDLRVNGDLSSPNRGTEVAAVVEGSSRQGLSDHSASDGPMHNRIDSETPMEIDADNQNEVLGGSVCIEDSNGSMQRKSDTVLKDDKGGIELSDKSKLNNEKRGNISKGDGSQLESGAGNSSGSSSRDDSVIVCLYQCCSYCVVKLRQLLLKILRYEWELKGNNMTVEDFHDLASSLSTYLQSAVRKLFETESQSHGCDEQLTESKRSKYFECPGACTSGVKSSGKKLMPINCSCHSTGESITEETGLLPKSRHGNDLKFIFRDDVLAYVEAAEQDAPFHCKFEKVCLCSLVSCIVMIKEPLD